MARGSLVCDTEGDGSVVCCDGDNVSLMTNEDHCGTCGNKCVDADCYQGECDI